MVIRFQIVSDIHIEKLYPKKATITDFIDPDNTADVLILAGDIGSAYHTAEMKEFLVSCKEHFKNVIYIPGNNEYYERDGYEKRPMEDLVNELKNICVDSGIIFMENSYIETDDMIIFGATWWSYIPDILSMKIYNREGSPITPKDFNQMHFYSRQCLDKIIDQKGNKKLVVITHYCPTKFGTMNLHHKKSDFESLVPYYFSSSEKFLNANQIDVWIFGHTHVFRDFYFNNTKTRIISNADPRKKFFRKNFTIDV